MAGKEIGKILLHVRERHINHSPGTTVRKEPEKVNVWNLVIIYAAGIQKRVCSICGLAIVALC